MEENKFNFLISSISDIQGNIRALDNKIIAIIIILAFPVSQLKFLISIYINLISHTPFVGIVLLSLLVISWLICLVFSFFSILSIDNPSKRITDNDGAKGIFYGANIFKIRFIDTLYTKNVQIKKTVNAYLKDFSETDLEKELIYEQMKLAYIRDVKSKRQKISIISALLIVVFIFLSQLIVLLNNNLQ